MEVMLPAIIMFVNNLIKEGMRKARYRRLLLELSMSIVAVFGTDKDFLSVVKQKISTLEKQFSKSKIRG